jgi:uncharacterized protein YegL
MSHDDALEVSYVENPEQRTLCAIIVDTSASMNADNRIGAVNQGLRAFEVALKADAIACKRVQVQIIECGGDRPRKGQWVDAADFVAPTLTASGSTPLGASAELALDQIDMATSVMQSSGVSYLKPWVLMLSDGEPTDPNWERGADRMRKWATDIRGTAFIFAVEGADMAKLARFQKIDGPIMTDLSTSDIAAMFKWLSVSLKSNSVPSASTTTALPPAPGTQFVAHR